MKPQASYQKKSSISFYIISLCFVFFVVILYGEDFSCILKQSTLKLQEPEEEKPEHILPLHVEQEKDLVLPFAVERGENECNLFSGSWVYDEETRPQYQEEECPYIQPQLTCQAHGRPDKGYLHWRWQPHECDLPRFNATFMLEKLRGKRMMFIGDSLNRGQYVSLVCLLHRSIPENAKSMTTNGSLTIFTAKDYNATIEFYWAPFLVESNSDDAIVHRVQDRIVRVGSINKHARHWKGIDIMVFNTYLWWMTGQKMKILRGSFDSETKNITLMVTEDAYRLAVRRMMRWVEHNMDPKVNRVFFASMSPCHERSENWGGEVGGNCYGETMPIKDPNYWGVCSRKSIMSLVGKLFTGTKIPVTVLNITQLSDYRKDAHTSIYKKQWNKLTPEQLANPKSYSDCVHWCLPGLQDTWNELLYAKLFFP
ncbi:hypothetical protein IEQ34_006078 [Dendrobium chrysotoxum]|uniref:Trichome birefringence-like N-terminal domain-containing protein n=1 Tax=Dendrobium chrysotoxum TaxID=161865 RepID=A0AAV7GVS1_DENCH|nr:hypothetical protein IEQ34_006078 [Dendrobium chrysotoxum]